MRKNIVSVIIVSYSSQRYLPATIVPIIAHARGHIANPTTNFAQIRDRLRKKWI